MCVLCCRSVREAVELLLRVSRPWSASEMTAHGALFMYEPVSDQGLPPPNIDHLLHPTFSPVNFPPYFRGLYLILYKLRQMEQLERSIDRRDSTDVLTKIRQLKRLSKQRVSLLGHYLYKAGRQLGADGVGILLPYVMEVMESPATSVQAAWCLFNPVAQVIVCILRDIPSPYDEWEKIPLDTKQCNFFNDKEIFF